MSKYPELNGLKGIEYRKAWNKLHKDRMRLSVLKHRLNNPDRYRALRAAQHKRHMAEHGMAATSLVNMEFREKAVQRFQRWTVREDKTLMSGLTMKQCALKLKRSLRAVMNRKHKLRRTATHAT